MVGHGADAPCPTVGLGRDLLVGVVPEERPTRVAARVGAIERIRNHRSFEAT